MLTIQLYGSIIFSVINSFSIFIVNIASTSHLRLLIVLLAFSANCIAIPISQASFPAFQDPTEVATTVHDTYSQHDSSPNSHAAQQHNHSASCADCPPIEAIQPVQIIFQKLLLIWGIELSPIPIPPENITPPPERLRF